MTMEELPDLSCADFYGVQYITTNLSEFKQRITDELNGIPRAMLLRAIDNFKSKLENGCMPRIKIKIKFIINILKQSFDFHFLFSNTKLFLITFIN